ncbi:MAG: hypothetical protein WEG40_10660 [Candidatus Rokuibacteriota bacterium]
MDRRSSCLTLILLLTGGTIPVIAPSAEPTVDTLMTQLLHPDTVTREAALRDIVRRGERTAVPGLIDILYFDLFLDSTVANALNGVSGQAFGHDWRRWVEWLAERDDVRPHGDYPAWKAGLLMRIDPAFGEFLYPGVKQSRAARGDPVGRGPEGRDPRPHESAARAAAGRHLPDRR